MCDESDSDDKPGGIRILNGRWCNAYLARWAVRPGYGYAIWKGSHVAEPTELSPEEAAGFWTEVGRVAAAMERRYRPVKMNWLSLGNTVPHLHVHLVPRYEDDDHAGGPIEADAFDRAHEHPVDEDTLRSEAEAVRALLSDPTDQPEMPRPAGTSVSLMIAVRDASSAAAWYRRALGATELWNLGSVVGLSIDGAPFFIAEPDGDGWRSPQDAGTTTVRVEVFVDDPDALIARAIDAGADGSRDRVRDHEAPWGTHRQGGFVDPFGHIWLVGDRSPLRE
jgi:diadenosine tetraphosphate (Ap4A) HIT family hydrolase/uncharacterized glyoxalase superfamily protein PhnB